MTKPGRISALIVLIFGITCGVNSIAQENSKFVRYQLGAASSYGLLDDDVIRQMDGAPWLGGKATGNNVSIDEVTLLAPVEPSKVIAVG